ncbi:lipase family protein [Nocardia sp. NPDC003345]
MRHVVRAMLGVLIFVAACCAGPAAAQADTAWYPGKLLADEPLSREWGGLGGVHRIEYVTTGPGGELVQAEAVVRLPGGTPPADGWRVVAWDHSTSGVGQECGLTGSESLEHESGPAVSRLNDAGYAVVAPDYIGLSPGSPGPHPYLQTSTEATATVDAVRAARAAFAGLSPSWAVAGASQGGHAALGTGHLAPAYAPELDFRGTAALAPAVNLESIFLRSRPGQPELPGFTGRAVPMVLAGMTGAELDVDVDAYLSPAGENFVAGLTTRCSARAGAMLATTKIGDLLARPLGDPEFAAAMRGYMGIPVSGYQDPILVVHGTYDAVIPLPLTLGLLADFAQHGTRHEVQLLEAGHDDLRDAGGMDRALDFLARVLPAR